MHWEYRLVFAPPPHSSLKSGCEKSIGADRGTNCLSWPGRNDSLHHLYSLERQKIEDDFKKGRDLVRQRLLDGVEERRRKIREDKESVGDVVAGQSRYLVVPFDYGINSDGMSEQ